MISSESGGRFSGEGGKSDWAEPRRVAFLDYTAELNVVAVARKTRRGRRRHVVDGGALARLQ